MEDEFLEVISSHSAAIPFPVFLVALLLAVSAVQGSDPVNYLPIVWLVVVSVVLLVRWYFLKDILDSKHVSKENRITLVIGLSLLNGLAHASSIFFFEELGSQEKAVQTLLLLGLTVGAVASTSGHRKIFSAYAFPVFLSMILSWALFGASADDGEPHKNDSVYRVAIPLFLLMFFIILLSLARKYSDMFTESFNIRSQEKMLNKQLTEALAETTEANASKTRFLAAASHDLRQPIHSLSFSSTALSLQNLDEESRKISKNMDKAIQALSKQMDSLLDISKLDAGVVEVNPEVFSLRDVLKQLHTNTLPQMQNKGLEFTLDLPNTSDKFEVETDYAQFLRVVNNLLNNAFKHTEKGRVDIQLNKVDSKAHLSITDTGEGISDADQKKIFDEFFQVKNPQRNSKEGLGLGLSIVKRLSKLLDIPFKLDSVLGKGTKVSLEIPLINQNTVGSEELELCSSDSRISILCVDDDKRILEAFRSVFEAMGCAVYLATGTAGALEMIKHKIPDVLLADLRLEGEDSGFETVRLVREVLPGLPAFLITGNSDPTSLRVAHQAGLEMLHKPVDAQFLLNKIQAELEI